MGRRRRSLSFAIAAAMVVHSLPALAQVAAGTTSSQVLSRVDPQLPSGVDVPANYEVSCKVMFDVDGQGMPAATTVSGCDEPFAEAARVAARQWRFRPTVVDGRGVAYKYSARLTFQRTTGATPVNQTLDTSTANASPSSQIHILQKVEPVLPAELRSMARTADIDEFTCKVRIEVDARGVPSDAVVLEAPDFLKNPLRDAALQWRFAPVVVEGQPQAFSYLWSMVWKGL